MSTFSALPPLRPSDPPEIEPELWRGMEGDLAFDIGARKGENFARLAALGYSGIIACEPEPGSYAELVQRFGHWQMIEDGSPPEGTTPWALLMHVAVSAAEGEVELAEVPLAISKGEWVTPGLRGMEWSPDDWDIAVRHVVPCTTLDALAEDAGMPDLVVIDTEGHERFVLQGATGILSERKAKWLIEFHAPELRDGCEAILTGAGYKVETVRHPHYAPGSHMFMQHGWLRAIPQED